MQQREAVVSLDTRATALAAVFIALCAVLFTPFSSYAVAAAPVTSPFRYTFNASGTLMEAGSMGESSSPYFWVNSGGKLPISGGVGMTVQGSLPVVDTTRQLYAKMNSLDTANGTNPQNTFRLVTRSEWGNSQETVKFKITKTNLADTPNRDGYSGIFLFGRYEDQYNLYYAGIRQDGQAVIKKKIDGTYYTLGEKQLFGSQDDYDRWTNANLIPEGKWMAIRARYENLAGGSVRVRLYIDTNNSGAFTEVLSVTDAGTGGAPLSGKGYAGIRTDYMDVQFDDFDLRNL